MTERISRRQFLAATGGTSVALAGCLGSDEGNGDGTDWREAELEDVVSGETFTIAELDGTAIVHTFAIWCGTCNRQNGELDDLAGQRDVEVVQLNIGDGEDDSDVVSYAADRGYGDRARFAVAPGSVSSSLADEFGADAVSPPRSPVIARCSDGTVESIDKVIRSDALAAELDQHCG